MKKIVASLGASHNEFEHQLKDLLNEMSDVISNIAKEQASLSEKIAAQHMPFFEKLCTECFREIKQETDHLRSDLDDPTLFESRFNNFSPIPTGVLMPSNED